MENRGDGRLIANTLLPQLIIILTWMKVMFLTIPTNLQVTCVQKVMMKDSTVFSDKKMPLLGLGFYT